MSSPCVHMMDVDLIHSPPLILLENKYLPYAYLTSLDSLHICGSIQADFRAK